MTQTTLSQPVIFINVSRFRLVLTQQAVRVQTFTPFALIIAQNIKKLNILKEKTTIFYDM